MPHMNGNDLRVLVVDDSAMVRQVMQAILGTDRRIVVRAAADPLIAWGKMQKESPDVVITDLEMPRMDGLTFLCKVMAEDPIPTLICSSVAARGTVACMRALHEGAVGIVTKPKLGVGNFLHESAVMLIDAVRSAAAARVHRRENFPVQCKPKPAASRISLAPIPEVAGRIVAIGASTGGTEALTKILTAMPKDSPGIVVVQHMPELFTAAFAKWLDNICQITVKEAEDGDAITSGRAFIAPGNRHMSVCRSGSQFRIQVTDGPLVSRHRPSVDVLFHSMARVAGSGALGIILTGMGDDGAAGLLEMRDAGAFTIAQNEATCVVFGMPKEAILRGAVCQTLPLESISGALINYGSHGTGISREHSIIR